MDCDEKDMCNREPSYLLVLKEIFFLSAAPTVRLIDPTGHKGIRDVQL